MKVHQLPKHMLQPGTIEMGIIVSKNYGPIEVNPPIEKRLF